MQISLRPFTQACRNDHTVRAGCPKLFQPLSRGPLQAPLTGLASGLGRGDHTVRAGLSTACDARPTTATATAPPHNAYSAPPHNAFEHPVPVASPLPEHGPDLGYSRNLEEAYDLGGQIGKGGNGVVRVAMERKTGLQYACKCIPKVLGPEASDHKRATHLESLKREVGVLRRLRGCLNLVELRDVYEDEDNVYILQELCQGGELLKRIGSAHYSERTVASFMRGALRTLAVMHSHHVLHRDIKPENFMFLNTSTRSPLKSIDFGLAVPFEPDQLPRTDLGLEGTPWYMAPETLSSQVLPASDLWSVGVMAHQLLTGRLPFDDRKNRGGVNPDVHQIWRSILVDEVDVDGKWFMGISKEARSFVSSLLNRDPAKRPTAKEALKHPWLQGSSAERVTGKELDKSVVQRIQRFGQSSEFKRLVLQSITEGMMATGEGGPIGPVFRIDPEGHAVVDEPQPSSFTPLLQRFHNMELARARFEEALKSIGFNLAPSEIKRLSAQLGEEGSISKSAFMASQMDWRALQEGNAERWLDMASKAFADLDTDGDGVITQADMLRALNQTVPHSMVQISLDQAMEEAGVQHGRGVMNMEEFLHMLRISSTDSLDMYDDRCSNTSSTDSSSSSLSDMDSQLAAAASSPRTLSTASVLDPSHLVYASSSAVTKQGVARAGDSSHHHHAVAGGGGSSVSEAPGSTFKAAADAAPKVAFRFETRVHGMEQAPKAAPVVFRFDAHEPAPNAAAVGVDGAEEVRSMTQAVPSHAGRMHGSDLYKNAMLPSHNMC